MKRPADTEYASFYRGYVSLVPEDDVLAVLEGQADVVARAVSGVPADMQMFRYEPGKWSVRELVGHVGDAERVFGYRAFCISRGEQAPLPGFDEKQYTARSGYDSRSLLELVDVFTVLRRANLSMLRALDAAAWDLVGTANAVPVSVRALAFIMAGHVRHHLRVLHERYGMASGPA
jgi:hypothetical protein